MQPFVIHQLEVKNCKPNTFCSVHSTPHLPPQVDHNGYNYIRAILWVWGQWESPRLTHELHHGWRLPQKPPHSTPEDPNFPFVLLVLNKVIYYTHNCCPQQQISEDPSPFSFLSNFGQVTDISGFCSKSSVWCCSSYRCSSTKHSSAAVEQDRCVLWREL